MKELFMVVLGLCTVFTSLSAISTPQQSLSDGLTLCLSEEEDVKRLACFDLLAKINQNKSIDLNPSHENITQLDNNLIKEKQQIDDFSKEDLVKTEEEKGLESITSSILNIKELLRGRLIIDLDNGQQWEQKDSKKIKLKVGDGVILKKGALGVVYLSKESGSRNIRVKRLK